MFLPWSAAFHPGSSKADPSQQDQPEGSAGLWVTQGTTERLPEATDTNSQPRASAPDFVTELYRLRITVAQVQEPALGLAEPHPVQPVQVPLQSLPILLQISSSYTNRCHLLAAHRVTQHPQPWSLRAISDTTGLASSGKVTFGKTCFP